LLSRWHDARLFESEQAHQFVVSGPGIAVPLTALIEPPLMYPSHVIEELVQAGGIARRLATVGKPSHDEGHRKYVPAAFFA